MKDKEKIKKRVIRIIVAVIIPVCAAFVFYQIDRMQLGGMYYCAEDNSGIYIQDLNEQSKEGYYMVVDGSEEDDFADTGDFELADVIGSHETAYDMASDNKDNSNALYATGMIHNSRKHTLYVTFILEDGTEITKSFRKQN
ncbi:MAG: hypothetical protein IKF42_11380 [Mogibacterium sp.]|nr:hypothetical protein [Mogibacterium sp.]